MGHVGLKGSGAAATLASQRMTAMSRSSRSVCSPVDSELCKNIEIDLAL